MGVYIKGMEMPQSCGNCYMFSFLSDSCRITNHVTEEMNDKMFDRRFNDCPLVPVPPHGRLGDLDALPWYLANKPVKYASYEDWEKLCDAIETAPIVIPASVEG